jgi:serine/threonine protein phosphatase PrpC
VKIYIMYCNQCKKDMNVEQDFCPECGLEFNNNSLNNNDTEVALPPIDKGEFKYDAPLRLKPLRSDFCYDANQTLVLVKSVNEGFSQIFNELKETTAEYLPKVIKSEVDHLILEWNSQWLTLSEWLRTEIPTETRIVLWREIVQFTALCHGKGVLVNNYSPDVIWINTETNKPIFEAMDFFSLEESKSVVICVDAISSPEVRSGEWENVSFQSDIFSLGKLFLYFLDPSCRNSLVNRPETFNDLKRLPISLGFTIGRCLKHPCDQRWNSIEQLIEQLSKNSRLSISIFGFSETGFRSQNEDAIYYSNKRIVSALNCYDFSLMILADGMGGLDNGAQASSKTIEFISNKLEEEVKEYLGSKLHESPSLEEHIPRLIEKSIQECNLKLIKEVLHLEKQWGSTAVVVVIVDNHFYMGYVGDSRVYIFDDKNNICYLTEDHSLVGKREAVGDLTEEEALIHPQKNVLYQALGLKEAIRVDGYNAELKLGQKVLICSDGISGSFLKRDLQLIFSSNEKLEELGLSLFYNALERNSSDNCSLILAEIGNGGYDNEYISFIS